VRNATHGLAAILSADHIFSTHIFSTGPGLATAPPASAAAPAAPPAFAFTIGLGLAAGNLRIGLLQLRQAVIEMRLGRNAAFGPGFWSNVTRLARQQVEARP
jgi:hypothetical protein